MKIQHAVYEYLQERNWIRLNGVESISYLAAGEYNENYVCDAADGPIGPGKYVFRINHGTQLGLDNQIGYEFAVLQSVEKSGVTPRPFHVDPTPGEEALDKGVLLMEFLEGGAFHYERHSAGAADVFARIHAQPVDKRLIVQRNAVLNIADESLGLLERFPDHPREDTLALLRDYHAKVLELAAEADSLLGGDPLVIVNTEVNSGNFLVDGDSVRLVDWEKAVVSSRFQDLGHFLVPTTTLWKTDYRFDDKARRAFLEEYAQRVETGLNMDELEAGTDLLERTILLRAMSWCYMAWYEYTNTGRALRNNDTFTVIERYLDEAECFLV